MTDEEARDYEVAKTKEIKDRIANTTRSEMKCIVYYLLLKLAGMVAPAWNDIKDYIDNEHRIMNEYFTEALDVAIVFDDERNKETVKDIFITSNKEEI